MYQQIQEEIDRYTQKIRNYQAEGKRILASSSFQTHSIPMLRILSEIDQSIPIYFLDTGFHFPETLMYKKQIGEQYGLDIRHLTSPIVKKQQINAKGEFSFVSDPDHCCYMNKVLPMEVVLPQYDVWISGVRKDQSKFRANFQEEEQGKHDTLRYHPMLNWDKKMIWRYIYDNDIPHHPLDAKGYESIGCEPCTAVRFRVTDDRNGRWEGMDKKECGLHIDLIDNTIQ